MLPSHTELHNVSVSLFLQPEFLYMLFFLLELYLTPSSCLSISDVTSSQKTGVPPLDSQGILEFVMLYKSHQFICVSLPLGCELPKGYFCF